MPIQHPRLRGAGKMSYIHITEENIDKEHICCAMSGKQSLAKKEWLKQRFNEGLVFYRSEERGKCFIEYIPAENAWVPIDADGWIYINCLWVAGSLKGHGHSGNLLSECIRDAKEQGRKGICILSAEGRKREFLADPKLLSYKGFEVTDISDCGINLMALPFEENAELPKFKECAKHPAVDEDGFVLYYTDQCPFTCYWVPRVRQTAEEHNIPFKTIHITDKETAQRTPAPVTTYALFRDGKFLTQGIQSDKKFLALAGLQRPESSTHWGNLPAKKAVGVRIVPAGGCFGDSGGGLFSNTHAGDLEFARLTETLLSVARIQRITVVVECVDIQTRFFHGQNLRFSQQTAFTMNTQARKTRQIMEGSPYVHWCSFLRR